MSSLYLWKKNRNEKDFLTVISTLAHNSIPICRERNLAYVRKRFLDHHYVILFEVISGKAIPSEEIQGLSVVISNPTDSVLVTEVG